METVVNPTFGPSTYGSILHINKPCQFIIKPLVIDIETDEKDNCVGFAATQDGKDIYYYTANKINDFKITGFLETLNLIGHNLKGDMKWLINWGIKLKSSQLFYDTMLASYVQNTTKESQGLKELAKEYLGMEWPSYHEMVGKGKAKQTLDKQEVGRVAAYCGMDCLATYRLYEYFKNKLTTQENKYLEEIELPTARALLDMELRGAQVDIEYLKRLNSEFEEQLEQLNIKIFKEARNSGVLHSWPEPIGHYTEIVLCACCNRTEEQFIETGKKHVLEKFNINSNRQIASLLQAQGAILPKTQKGNLKVDKATLEQWKHLPAVPLLLEYSKIEKLKSTYTEALLEKQKNGRIFCSFNQLSKDSKGNSVGISTGRLSSSNPNLQNIPTRTEEGKQIRHAFIPGNGKCFIDADFSQIEPRLVAHFTGDRTFVEAYQQNRDIYQELVEGTGRDRQDGKTFMLALLYGAQAKKLSAVFKCSEKEAESIVSQIMQKLPGVVSWINRVKWGARQKKGVRTLFGRWIPLPKINSQDKYERLHWERVAVNAIIQGSAAEIMKKSLIALHEVGYSSVLTVHDEFLIEEENHSKADTETHTKVIKSILENIVKLNVPLKVDVGIGSTWLESKE